MPNKYARKIKSKQLINILQFNTFSYFNLIYNLFISLSNYHVVELVFQQGRENLGSSVYIKLIRTKSD